MNTAKTVNEAIELSICSGQIYLVIAPSQEDALQAMLKDDDLSMDYRIIPGNAHDVEVWGHRNGSDFRIRIRESVSMAAENVKLRELLALAYLHIPSSAVDQESGNHVIGILREALSETEKGESSRDVVLGIEEACASLQEHNAEMLKQVYRAWEATEDIQRFYDSASEEPCKCGTDPSACEHCSLWEKADRQVSKIRSILEKLIPEDYDPIEDTRQIDGYHSGGGDLKRDFNVDPITQREKELMDRGWQRHLASGPQCALPPKGWECTRVAGHTGPCAAQQIPNQAES